MSSLPSTQKALFVTGWPGPIEVRDRPVPQSAGEGEVIIKVMAAAVNGLDTHLSSLPWAVVKGFPGVPAEEQPLVNGFDLAGEVVAVGSDVTDVKVGDRVIGAGTIAAPDSMAYQQYAKIPARFAGKIPPSVSYDAASTLETSLLTAVTGLYLHNGLKAPWQEGGIGAAAGKPIVIIGASGAVGQFAIQCAKLSGFSPIIATASPQHTEHLKSLGATHVVPHTTTAAEFKALAPEGSPIGTLFLIVANDDNIPIAVDTLPRGGTLLHTRYFQNAQMILPVAEPKGLKVVTMLATPYHPQVAPFAIEMYKALPGLLEDGSIKPVPVKVVKGGVNGVHEAFKLFPKSAGVKLVIRPHETV